MQSSVVQASSVRYSDTHLAILQLKYQLHFLSIHQLLLDLGGHPALRRVGLPGPCADLVNVRHETVVQR